ncbi:alpha/beta hydrolase [Bacillus sp. AFS001701]|uniref:alpha/beta fold hydrolase n=1 Tax=Bacillaceae TaxID=186817 RepID=UPI000BF92726|nr:alpha/beta hydrolase [Bacillus sp. AFS001701]PET56395.1 alpha/beta hydrolase [Bacillus sp. AFS001701]
MNNWEGLISAKDRTKIYLRKYIPAEPIAVIQIVHGMAEHGGAYDKFIEYLVHNQFAVFIHDQRGHGKTAAIEDDLGFFGEEIGWDEVAKDIIFISKMIRKEIKDIPLILFGHSMGSYLSRRVVQLNGGLYDGLIISGTGYDPGILRKLGVFISSAEAFLIGANKRSKILDFLTFGNFNNHFKFPKTKYDWLTRDEAEIDRYIKDPFCGFICSSSYYRELLKGIGIIHRKEEIKKTPPSLPIYIFSGDKDPVGQNGDGVKKVYGLYKDIGCTNVKLKLYEEGRHEMLHETNKDEVHQDVKTWIEETILNH